MIGYFAAGLRIALLALVLTSCATRSTVVLRHDLAKRQTCCASYAEMNFSMLGTDEIEATFGNRSPIFAFAEGKGYFSAYSLPDNDATHGLVFRSYLTSEFLPDTSVFMPDFIFLDRNKKELQSVHDVPMHSGGANFWLGGFYVGTVRIPQDAAFVVVYSTGAVRQPMSATSENGTVWSVPSSLSGKLKLALSR